MHTNYYIVFVVAKSALKRKKMHESNLEKITGQIDSLENNLLAIESANLNYETMKAMQQGAKAMKHIHGNMNIDKVDQTMDEIEEQITLGQEISNAISRPMGNEVDEDELLDELEQLEQETLEEKMVSVGKAPTGKLPSVGDSTKAKPIAQEEDDEEEELRKLQAEMALWCR